MAYYDGTKILSMTDINGLKPELYIVTTNRTGGKTTYFGRLLVNKWLQNGEKFAILYRYNYELDDCADKFFKDIGTLFFRGSVMESRKRGKGIYCELLLDGKVCGYALSINSADALKKYSHLFSDVKRMLFDEFMPETGTYCPNEVQKFLSVHTSVARGQGEQVRYVPVYMLANPITLINPYYVKLGISDRIRSDTKFLKGDGFVLEQGYCESAAQAQKLSGINRAFASDSYIAYAAEGVYLNDTYAFIEKPEGTGRYICTIRYMGTDYAIRQYPELGIVYCDKRVDQTFPTKIAATTDDHQINYVMLKTSDLLLGTLKYFFQRGCFRFKDLQCKAAIINVIGA